MATLKWLDEHMDDKKGIKTCKLLQIVTQSTFKAADRGSVFDECVDRGADFGLFSP